MLLSCNNYKKFIKEQVNKNKSIKGYQSKLADEIGCQRAYLSRVINGEQHFTLEHGVKAAEFWGLSATETDYFLNLALVT